MGDLLRLTPRPFGDEGVLEMPFGDFLLFAFSSAASSWSRAGAGREDAEGGGGERKRRERGGERKRR